MHVKAKEKSAKKIWELSLHAPYSQLKEGFYLDPDCSMLGGEYLGSPETPLHTERPNYCEHGLVHILQLKRGKFGRMQKVAMNFYYRNAGILGNIRGSLRINADPEFGTTYKLYRTATGIPEALDFRMDGFASMGYQLIRDGRGNPWDRNSRFDPIEVKPPIEKDELDHNYFSNPNGRTEPNSQIENEPSDDGHTIEISEPSEPNSPELDSNNIPPSSPPDERSLVGEPGPTTPPVSLGPPLYPIN